MRPTRPGIRKRKLSTALARGCFTGRVPSIERLENRVCLSGTYASAANYAVSFNPDFIASADVNGDGKRDLISSSYADGSLDVLLGNGDGTFQTAVTTYLTNAPDFVITGDVNNDGKIDLVTANYDTDSVSVLLGNGNGTFQSPVSYAAGTGPRAVVLGDFTGDGSLDIACAKSYDSTLTILKNNGNGTFAAATNTSLSITPTDLVTGDFNGDGKLDLAAADFFHNTVAIMLGNGNGTFQSPVTASSGAGPTSIAAGDFDGDGKLDLVTANFLDNSVSLFRGNGNGTLQTATSFAAGSGATFVSATDLDSDGKLDMVTANANDNTINVFFGNGNATFQSVATYSTGNSPRSITVGDFDGTTLRDIAVTNEGASSLSVLLGGGATTPPPVASAAGPYTVSEGGTVQLSGAGSTGTSLTYAWDLDGDGIFGETGAGATRGNETGATPTFSAVGLDGPGSRTVSLRVTDSSGRTSTTTATINITNVAPTLTISGSNSVNEGSTYTLNLSATDPGPDTISNWVITWGDGNVQTINSNPSSITHTFADNGAYTISATATDEDGTYSANSKNVTVANVPPTLVINGSTSVPIGSLYTLNLSASDPGTDTLTSWQVNWGDGTIQSFAGSSSSATHTYTGESAAYTIAASATDEDGTYSANSIQVDALGQQPLAVPGGSYSVPEGGSVQLDGAGSFGDSLTYAWDLDGDGVYGETGASATRGDETGATPTFSAAGLDGPSQRTVSLRVTDSIGRVSTQTAIIYITNVPPTLTASGAATVTAGNVYTLNLSATDPGPDTISQWVIDWGDGAQQTLTGDPSTATHTYSGAGIFSIGASATDEDGTYDANPMSVSVSALPDTTNPTAALLSAQPMLQYNGKPYLFTVTYSDNVAVDAQSLDSSNVLVTGPGGFSQLATLVSMANGAGNSRVATYSIAQPGGAWDVSDNGAYALALQSGQVRDSAGNFALPATLGSFQAALLPADTAGNDLGTARSLGTFSAGTIRVVEDGVGLIDRNDFFRIVLPAKMTMSTKLTNLTDDADLQLLDSTGARLVLRKHIGTTDEIINTTLKAGTYYIRVQYSYSLGTPYRLRVAATTPAPVSASASALPSAQDLGTLSSGQVRALDGYVGADNVDDYYSFSISQPTLVYFKLTGLSENANMQILNGDGESLKTSRQSGTSNESVTLSLPAGTYFVHVYFAGVVGTNYRLRLAGT